MAFLLLPKNLLVAFYKSPSPVRSTYLRPARIFELAGFRALARILDCRLGRRIVPHTLSCPIRKVASQEQSDLMRFRRIALAHWFGKTIVFSNSRQTAFFSQKASSNGSKYSFRKTKLNLFEPDE